MAGKRLTVEELMRDPELVRAEIEALRAEFEAIRAEFAEIWVALEAQRQHDKDAASLA